MKPRPRPWTRQDLLPILCRALSTTPDHIGAIRPMKLGMTNRSFLFSMDEQHYILRIPGEGTEKLIDRPGEAEAYRAVAATGIPDQVIHLDPATGVKITRYWEGARTCNIHSEDDLRRCMALLRQLHTSGLAVPRQFDLFATIEFYESLWGATPSAYSDYAETKRQVLSLRPYLTAMAAPTTLAHIDAVPANFLFVPDGRGGEALHLIDWEYSAMQDPDVDIAMFAVSDLPDRQDADRLMDLYYPGGCPDRIRSKIHGYMAVCGLLWSNWCEYKHQLGVEFGPYARQQYQCAQTFSRLALQEWGERP